MTATGHLYAHILAIRSSYPTVFNLHQAHIIMSHPESHALTPPPSVSSKQTAASTFDSPSTTTASTRFLKSLLGRTLHCHVRDGRRFTGEFKCTDGASNVILAKAYEYRMPSTHPAAGEGEVETGVSSMATPMTGMALSRFMGLVVVPGQHITRIEVEGQASDG